MVTAISWLRECDCRGGNAIACYMFKRRPIINTEIPKDHLHTQQNKQNQMPRRCCAHSFSNTRCVTTQRICYNEKPNAAFTNRRSTRPVSKRTRKTSYYHHNRVLKLALKKTHNAELAITPSFALLFRCPNKNVAPTTHNTCA